MKDIDKIIQGDCLEVLKSLPDGIINTCITSPPYYGLRDYGVEGQIGLEETPDAYVQRLVEVFREVKRVLRDDGTLWLNLGDSYAGSGKGSNPDGTPHPSTLASKSGTNRGCVNGKNLPQKANKIGLKPKDLIGIPWRVAFALQADGWYLRQDIIWHKPNPMPESVTDRCTKSHEYIFLLSKSQKYHYDNEAIREENVNTERTNYVCGSRKNGENKDRHDNDMVDRSKSMVSNGRNKRSVWIISTKPYSGAHFATFPPDLIEPCVLAGCPEGGVVLDPFGGSGTTGGVAMKLNRKAILCELNPEYVGIMEQRIREIVNEKKIEQIDPSQIDLF